jgi:hypothetical protein
MHKAAKGRDEKGRLVSFRTKWLKVARVFRTLCQGFGKERVSRCRGQAGNHCSFRRTAPEPLTLNLNLNPCNRRTITAVCDILDNMANNAVMVREEAVSCLAKVDPKDPRPRDVGQIAPINTKPGSQTIVHQPGGP